MRFMIDQSRSIKTLLPSILLIRIASLKSWDANDSTQSQKSFESSIHLQQSTVERKPSIWSLKASHCFIANSTSWWSLTCFSKKLIIIALNVERAVKSMIIMFWFRDSSKAATTWRDVDWLSTRFFQTWFAMWFKHSMMKYCLTLKYKWAWILFQFWSTLTSE